jgi:beta-lactamase regulating signal transducer with metallopeptidase domain
MHIAALFTESAMTAPAAFAWLVAHSQSFASDAGSALITAFWQGAVIVCVLEIASRVMPRISAAHRFALWSVGFALTLALPLLSLLHLGDDSAPALASTSGNVASTHPLLQLDARWGLAIAALWFGASLIRAAALAVHSIRLRRLWKAARPVELSHTLSVHLNNLRNGGVAICTTQMLDRPSVIGFLSPRILIPDWLLSRLTPGELNQIVLHEAEHLRRRDDWINLFQKLCLVVFPLNPALAWIEHRLCREREMACDEGVVRITNAPRAYAACLASLAERHLERRAEALSLGAWHRRSELVHRVHRILLHKRTMSTTAAGTLLATLGSMLLAGSVEMSRFPQLVAFVPKHNTQAMTPARQVQLDALLVRENAEAKLHLPASYHAIPAKVVVPDQRSTPSAHTRRHPALANAAGTHPPSNASQVTTQEVAKSELLGDRVISSEPPPQQWVVVTTWREVSSASRVPQTISDFETESESANAPTPATNAQNTATATAANAGSTKAANPQAQSPGSKNQAAPPAHRFTVTQLILRVIPASPNSSSTQPSNTTPQQALTVRDGWFVIQL